MQLKNNQPYLMNLATMLFISFVGLVQVNAQINTSQQAAAKDVESIENGLRATVRFKDDPTWNIKERMQHYGVPGVSVAIIKDHKIHLVKHYGVTDRETNRPVDHNTLFQAGSISKPVAAYGALKLVEQGKLSLDQPVNQYLKDWHIPENELTKKQPVALKHLLNHSAGLTVHGFWGYSQGLPVPSILQILNGEKPANSGPIVVDLLPGEQMRYSGGGYTVMQKLVTDITNKTFPEALNQLVIEPIGMQRSTFQQPLSDDQLKFAAAGYLPNNKPVAGKRHVYPEMAAAGLWTTAEDLAKFAIDVQKAIKSNQSKVLSESMANKMLTPWVSQNVGLGFFVDTKKKNVYFGHGGWDEGFSADLVAHKTAGYGVAIMTNSNHPAFIEELKNSIALTYNWQEYLPPDYQSLEMTDSEVKRISGRYFFNPDMLFTIGKSGDKVIMRYLDGSQMQVHKIAENLYIRKEFDRKFSFVENSESQQVELVFDMGNGTTVTRRRLAENEMIPFEFVVNGQLDKAKQLYQQLLASQPNMTEQAEWNILHYAEQYSDKSEYNQAKELLVFASTLFPDSINSLERLAQQYVNLSETKLAIGSYQKILQIEPKHQPAIKALEKLEAM
jgi:CubicO group peptidase (beta-lactamase class C family)